MSTEYIQAALRRVKYEVDDHVDYAEVPELPGVLAYGDTLEACRQQLIEVIEGWLIVGFRHGDTLPVLDSFRPETAGSILDGHVRA